VAYRAIATPRCRDHHPKLDPAAESFSYRSRTRPAILLLVIAIVVQAVLLAFCVMAYRVTTGDEVAQEKRHGRAARLS